MNEQSEIITPETSRQSTVKPALIVLLYIVAVLITASFVGGIFTAIFSIFPSSGLFVQLGQERATMLAITAGQVGAAVSALVVTLFFLTFRPAGLSSPIGYQRTGTWSKEFWFGTGLGFILIAAIFVLYKLAGWSTITGYVRSGSRGGVIYLLVLSVIFMVAVAISEETMMRGFVLRVLAHRYGPVPGLVASSVIFGLLHFANPGHSFAGFLGTAAAGLVLGYGYLVTERLWLPVGFHFAWNLAEGTIFGFPVSGAATPELIHQRISGPHMLTGNAFGPESSVLAPLVLVFGAALIWRFSRQIHSRDHQAVSR